MKIIAQIIAKDDGGFELAVIDPLPVLGVAQVLLSLTSALIAQSVPAAPTEAEMLAHQAAVDASANEAKTLTS